MSVGICKIETKLADGCSIDTGIFFCFAVDIYSPDYYNFSVSEFSAHAREQIALSKKTVFILEKGRPRPIQRSSIDVSGTNVSYECRTLFFLRCYFSFLLFLSKKKFLKRSKDIAIIVGHLIFHNNSNIFFIYRDCFTDINRNEVEQNSI